MTGLIEIVLRNGLRRYWTKGQFAGSTICIFPASTAFSRRLPGPARSIVYGYLYSCCKSAMKKLHRSMVAAILRGC